ncbi:MAG: hypothetical protein MJK04_05090 [Psychrosphaera sp.]|nr:hypothetical protein [Psychrosphaera sp.]
MSDPDKGDWTYEYNARGDLVRQTDGKGQSTQNSHDQLGRLINRIDRNSSGTIEGNSSWYYDNSTGPDGGATATNAVGKLHWVQDSVSGYRQVKQYDGFGRPSQTTTRIDGTDYVQSVSYDTYGRVQDRFDVSGSGIRFHYNAYGHLEKRQDISATHVLGTVYWQAIKQDARGYLTQQHIGNGGDIYHTYKPQSGRVDAIIAVNGTSYQILQYQFDAGGNLIERFEQDNNKMLIESFGYDNLNRLTSANVSGGAQQNISYDGLGNILSKTGLSGSYQYGGSCNGITAGPHAVTQAGGQSYCYDTNGNQISGNGRTLSYNVFDKPIEIIKGSTTTQFSYAPGRKRFKRVDIVDGQTTTTRYLGDVELITRPSGVIETKRAINGMVIVTDRSNATGDVRYLHRDHLGSIGMISDENGQQVASLSFDAFGQRRDTLTWDQFMDPYYQLADIGSILNITTRGFTGHEMLDQAGLIHMGGRVYDPLLGRFLSADPNVQAPGNTQSYNRYSYVMNNPLSYTDPSGFFFKKLKKFLKKFWRPILAAILVIATYGAATAWVASWGATWGVAATATSAASLSMAGTVALGAMAGAVSGAIVTGSWKGALNGAISGAIMGVVSGYYGNRWNMQRVAAKGVAGGIASEATGGKFMDGLKSNLSTSLLSLSNYKMRAAMVQQSKVNTDNLGKDSKGFFGDGHGIAGTRRIVNPEWGTKPGIAKYLRCDGAAGGCQGPVLPGSTDVSSHLGPMPYNSGDLLDTASESFAGPHDWLSDRVGMYDALGNGIARDGFMDSLYGTISWTLIPIAAPFAVAGLIETRVGAYR